MKIFLLKISLFFALCALAFGGAYGIRVVRLRTISFEIPKDKTVVFIGDSHIEIGVNPELIPCAYNFAKSGDPYLDQYCRLKRLLDDNPQISHVFVTATPHSLARYGDARLFSDWTLQNVVSFAFPIYGEDERAIYFSHVGALKKLAKFTFLAPRALVVNALRPREKLLAKLGAYLVSSRKNLERSVAVERGLSQGERLHGDDSAGNALQLKYLRKIIDLAREHGARVLLLNPPLYRSREFFDVDFFNETIAENFSDVEFWDYADFPVPDDCRGDINHLNRWGAEIFSKEIAARMTREGIIRGAD